MLMFGAASGAMGEVSREYNWFNAPPSLSSFPTEFPKVVPLLLFLFVFASVVSYVAFVLSLFVHHRSFFWCLGRGVLCDTTRAKPVVKSCVPHPIRFDILNNYALKCVILVSTLDSHQVKSKQFVWLFCSIKEQ